MTLPIQSQETNEQLWVEYFLNYPFAKNLNLENSFTYSTLLEEPKWRSYEYGGEVTWSVNQHLDLIGQLLFSYTNQDATNNSIEIRPNFGTRFHLTPNYRVLTRLQLRLEQRNFQDLETKEWDQVYRPRIRGEVIAPINKKSYSMDKLWYVLTDVELLYTENDLDERFANRFRMRFGVGYRLSYNTRFEIMYMLQESKDEIDVDFQPSDNIFRFRFKHYLRKSKPTKPKNWDTNPDL